MRKRFADGKVSLPYKHFLGYDKGENDLPVINEEQAKTVKYIFRLFLEGHAPTRIARQLTTEGIPSPSGKNKWYAATVESILKNEKYKGDALLGKRVTIDFLSKRQKKNEGEGPQWFVKSSHKYIVQPETFDLVQLEFEKRKEKGYTSRVTPLSNRIVCGECGGFFGSKVWHSTTKYRRTIWQCNQKFKNEKRCQTPHLNETVIQELFVEAFNSTIQNKAEILACFQEIMDRLTSWHAIEQKRDQVDSAMLKLKDQVEALINRNSRVILDQAEYNAQHDQLMQRFHDLQAQRSDLTAQIGRLKLKHNQAKVYLQTLEQQSELLTEFDEGLFAATIERITIHSLELATLKFKDESELCWPIRKPVNKA